LAAAQVIVFLVDHAAFKSVAASRLAGKHVIDTRGIWTF
jgi:UDP-N-acetyl-D-mannosaminuronic acid dehydrogenase